MSGPACAAARAGADLGMSGLSAEVVDFIASGRVGRLATADGSGQPLVVPICYAWDGEALLSAVVAKPTRASELSPVSHTPLFRSARPTAQTSQGHLRLE